MFLPVGPCSSKTFLSEHRLAGNVRRSAIERKGLTMSKKMMLLALAVASMTMFALPAASSAQEIHWEGVMQFTGDATAETFVSEGEPTFTCETTHVTGTVSAGGTTGSISYDTTGCHTTVFGFTAKCRTAGSPLDNTIKSAGSFHFITTTDGPAILHSAYARGAGLESRAPFPTAR